MNWRFNRIQKANKLASNRPISIRKTVIVIPRNVQKSISIGSMRKGDIILANMMFTFAVCNSHDKPIRFIIILPFAMMAY